MRKTKTCHHCGRKTVLAHRFGNGKQTVRHNCPHGIPCSASDGILSSNNSYSGRCLACRETSKRAKE